MSYQRCPPWLTGVLDTSPETSRGRGFDQILSLLGIRLRFVSRDRKCESFAGSHLVAPEQIICTVGLATQGFLLASRVLLRAFIGTSFAPTTTSSARARGVVMSQTVS